MKKKKPLFSGRLWLLGEQTNRLGRYEETSLMAVVVRIPIAGPKMFGGVGSFLIFPIPMDIIQVKLVPNTCSGDERCCVKGQDIEYFEQIDAGASVDRLQRISIAVALRQHVVYEREA